MTNIWNQGLGSLTMNISNLSTMPFLLLCGLARGDTCGENRKEKKEKKVEKIDGRK
jgi:hypothetical protein